MERRRFLQLSLGSVAAFSLPSFANTNLSPLQLPEQLKQNPLLKFDSLPDFATVKPSDIKPAIDFLLQHSMNTIEMLTAQKNITWENFYLPLQEIQNKLDRAWSIASHLHSVKNSKTLRSAYNDAKKSLTEYDTWYGMHRPLYQAFSQLKNSKHYLNYTKAQKKAIDDALLDFKLSGMALVGDDAKRYAHMSARLSALKTQFSNNVLDASKGWELVIEDVSQLKGLSELAILAAKESANKKGVPGYRFSLDYPSYAALVTYADDRELRKQMYTAYRTRASDQGPNAGKWDNMPIIKELTKLRLQLAQLLGYQNYAEYALAKRMADSPKQVLDFLNDLLNKTRPKAQQERMALENYAKSKGLIDDNDALQAWDLAYVAEKQKQEQYDIDTEALRIYFPIDKVLSGMFEIVNRLFGITFQEKTGVSVAHPDVRFFEMHKDGTHIASFYLDLYAREDKRSGAWHSSVIGHYKKPDGSIQLPVSTMVCNFRPPSQGEPALLLHDEAETLFHEFGHGLHSMLTQVDVLALAGTAVPWDAVEFPSQMLENWLWNQESLALMSEHYQTKEPLPMAVVQKMLAAKNYQAAMSMVRQLEYGLFDMRLNTEYNKKDTDIVERIREDIRTDVSVIDEPRWVRTANSFNHIFSGGYAAGYYSYLWSDVLASDAYTRFAKEGVLNRKTGQDFVDAILSRGGVDDPMEMFVSFMGRKPNPDALLFAKGIL